MKFILTFIFCSQVAGTCLPPVPIEDTFDTRIYTHV